MMRSLGGHVHTVNGKVKKFTSKKKVLRIKTGVKWLKRETNVYIICNHRGEALGFK